MKNTVSTRCDEEASRVHGQGASWNGVARGGRRCSFTKLFEEGVDSQDVTRKSELCAKRRSERGESGSSTVLQLLSAYLDANDDSVRLHQCSMSVIVQAILPFAAHT